MAARAQRRECHKRCKHGKRDDDDDDQGEGPDEDERPPENDGGGDPFDYIRHDFTNTSPSSSRSTGSRSPARHARVFESLRPHRRRLCRSIAETDGRAV